MSKSLCGRVLHWGPLGAMAITASVTHSTLQLSSPWLTKNNSSPLGITIIFLFLMTACYTLFNLWCCMLIGPGYLPLEWGNSTKDNKKRIRIRLANFWSCFGLTDETSLIKLYEEKNLSEEEKSGIELCKSCRGYKAHRAHHCRKCDRCVIKMDHHCPWINNCVGEMNHVYFIKFLIFAILTTMQSSGILGTGLYRAFYIRYYYLRNDDPHTLVFLDTTRFFFTVFNLGLSFGVVVSVSGLLYQQLRAYNRDITMIESLKKVAGKDSKDAKQSENEVSGQKVKENHLD